MIYHKSKILKSFPLNYIAYRSLLIFHTFKIPSPLCDKPHPTQHRQIRGTANDLQHTLSSLTLSQIALCRYATNFPFLLFCCTSNALRSATLWERGSLGVGVWLYSIDWLMSSSWWDNYPYKEEMFPMWIFGSYYWMMVCTCSSQLLSRISDIHQTQGNNKTIRKMICLTKEKRLLISQSWYAQFLYPKTPKTPPFCGYT